MGPVGEKFRVLAPQFKEKITIAKSSPHEITLEIWTNTYSDGISELVRALIYEIDELKNEISKLKINQEQIK